MFHIRRIRIFVKAFHKRSSILSCGNGKNASLLVRYLTSSKNQKHETAHDGIIILVWWNNKTRVRSITVMRSEIPQWNHVSGVLRRERTWRRDCWTRANLPEGKVPFGPYSRRDYPGPTVSVVCHSVTRRSKFSVRRVPTYKGILGAAGIAESRKYIDTRIDTVYSARSPRFRAHQRGLNLVIVSYRINTRRRWRSWGICVRTLRGHVAVFDLVCTAISNGPGVV